MNRHPNSKVVRIKRKIAIGDYKQEEVETMFGDASRPVSAYWIKGTSKAGTGLTYEEQKILMPLVLNCEITDRDFRAKSEQYFHDINTRVGKEGTELEIGLEDNGSLVSELNHPLNPTEYIAYKHAISHPQVSKNKQVNVNPLIKWYLEDDIEELGKEQNLLNIKDEAAQLYLANKDNKKIVNMVLKLSSIDVAEGKKQISFRKISEETPVKFKELITDKDISLKYMVSLAIKEGVLKQVNNTTMWAESGDALGNNTEEVLVYLKDKSKAMEVNKIKAALKSFED